MVSWQCRVDYFKTIRINRTKRELWGELEMPVVVPIAKKTQELNGEVDWRRELGVQIALQLPRKAADAAKVLDWAKEAYRRLMLAGDHF